MRKAGHQNSISMKGAVQAALLKNYCNFSGRASRPEFWWPMLLFTCIVLAPLLAGLLLIHTTAGWILIVLPGPLALALAVPSLGLTIRRLHDTGREGYWILVGLIPVAGWIALLRWCSLPGTTYPNLYGPVPHIHTEPPQK